MITIKAADEPNFKWCMYAPLKSDDSIIGGTYYEDLKTCLNVALYMKDKFKQPYFVFIAGEERINVETDGDIMQIMLTYGYEA